MYHIADMWIVCKFIYSAVTGLISFPLAAFMLAIVIYLHTVPTRYAIKQ